MIKLRRFWHVLNITSLIFLIILSGCSNNKVSVIYKNNKQEQSYQKVSFKDLLERPEYFSNNTIEMVGFYKSDFEVSALYSNRRSLNDQEMKKAVWIRFDVGYPLFKDSSDLNLVKSNKEFEKINGKKIKIRGRFFPDSKGHLSMYSGTIGNVVYLQVLN